MLGRPVVPAHACFAEDMCLHADRWVVWGLLADAFCCVQLLEAGHLLTATQLNVQHAWNSRSMFGSITLNLLGIAGGPS